MQDTKHYMLTYKKYENLDKLLIGRTLTLQGVLTPKGLYRVVSSRLQMEPYRGKAPSKLYLLCQLCKPNFVVWYEVVGQAVWLKSFISRLDKGIPGRKHK